MYNSSPKPYSQPFWVHFRVAIWLCVKTSPRANHSYENVFRPPSGSFKLKLNLFSYERMVSPRGTKWLANGQHPFFIRRLFYQIVNILISQRITFLFSKVSGVWIVFISSFEACLPACLPAGVKTWYEARKFLQKCYLYRTYAQWYCFCFLTSFTIYWKEEFCTV